MRNRKEMIPKFVRDILEFVAKMRGPVPQIKRKHRKVDRNERCRCGSPMKYKNCHWAYDVEHGLR